MSIASELTTLAANKAAIKSAIEAKSPVIAPTDALSQWPTAIASIPTGGGEWWLDPDWPDIRTVAANDVNADYQYKIIILYRSVSAPIAWACGGAAYKFSDGHYEVGSTVTYANTDQSEYSWVIVYSNSQTIRFYANFSSNAISYIGRWLHADGDTIWSGGVVANSCALRVITGNHHKYGGGEGSSQAYVSFLAYCEKLVGSPYDGYFQQFGGNAMLQEVGEVVLPDSGTISFEQMFASCYSLKALPQMRYNGSTGTNFHYFCYKCFSLVDMSGLDSRIFGTGTKSFANFVYDCYNLQNFFGTFDFSICSRTDGFFYNCVALRKVPDVINLTNSTNIANMFTGCYSVTNLPTHLMSNLSVSFADLKSVDSGDYLATFDSNGEIDGGMVYNLNTPSTACTLTLNAVMVDYFTAEQRAKITAALSAKNWTLSCTGW